MSIKNKTHFIYYLNSFDLINKFLCTSTPSIPKITKVICNLNVHKMKNYIITLSEEEYGNFLLKIWILLNFLNNNQIPLISSFQYRELKRRLKTEKKKKEEVSVFNFYNVITKVSTFEDWFILLASKIHKPVESKKKELTFLKNINTTKFANNLRFSIPITEISIKKDIITGLFSIEELLHLELQLNIHFRNKLLQYFDLKKYKNIFPLWSIQD